MKIPSCNGCLLQKKACNARDTFRAATKGLRITTVRFRCGNRITEFPVGTPVWAETVNDQSVSPEEMNRGDFPGVVVREHGSRVIVFIKPEAPMYDDPEITFTPHGRGFCRIPLSRLRRRDGENVRICASCEQPEGMGHPEGHRCSAPTPLIKWIGDQNDD